MRLQLLRLGFLLQFHQLIGVVISIKLGLSKSAPEMRKIIRSIKNISFNLPAGIVHRLSEKVPEVEELAVKLLDSLKLFVAELCQSVSSGRPDLYHSHV